MKFFAVILYYLKKNWGMIFLLVLGVVIIGRMTTWGANEPSTFFKNYWDSLFGLLGVLLTVGLTVFYAYNEWIDQLDRVLIVHFKDNTKRYVASCYNVNILPNAELRGLGQQLGAQLMERGRDLKFNPSVKLIKTDILKVKTVGEKSKWVRYYEIEFKLLENIFENSAPFYRIWNMGDDDEPKKNVEISTKIFHNSNNVGIILEDLLNSDKKSMDKFKAINNINMNQELE